jgi:hypothetical protein
LGLGRFQRPTTKALYGTSMKVILFFLFLSSLNVHAEDPFENFPAQYAAFNSGSGLDVNFRVMGDAAKKMYVGIKSEAHSDMCEGSGNLIKEIGGVECHFNALDQSYICYFGIKLDSGEFNNGITC